MFCAVRKKIPHALYIQELHKFSQVLIKRESRGEEWGKYEVYIPGKTKESEAIMVLLRLIHKNCGINVG